MRRQKMRKRRLDSRVFSHTARKVKKKNLIPKNMRGGIRL
ncbi:hypothetical protein [Dipodfec virus UOA04_Rod_907]|nr:hypothetical protein [Dipodfec virus UOA04_Rod_907]